MRQPGEPSVNEILDSIKKVIARDDRAEPQEDSPDEDVLDLTMAEHSVPGEHETLAEPLLTEGSRAALRAKLASLTALTDPVNPRAPRPGETSLEGLVRELLRPALSAWLDQHLPAMVERLVASEIARIVGKSV